MQSFAIPRHLPFYNPEDDDPNRPLPFMIQLDRRRHAPTTTSLFDVFPIFPTLPKCSHPPHHPFGNPCELTLHSINRILSKHIVKLNEAESSRRLGHVRNTLWSVRRRCTLHCVIARQDSAARRRCAVVPLLQRHISDMPFIEAAFAHSAPQFSELERTMCFAHSKSPDLSLPPCIRHSSHKMSFYKRVNFINYESK